MKLFGAQNVKHQTNHQKSPTRRLITVSTGNSNDQPPNENVHLWNNISIIGLGPSRQSYSRLFRVISNRHYYKKF